MPVQVVGPIAYPNVKGLDQASAEATLEASYIQYSYGTAAYSSTVDEGEILTQDPDPDVTSEIDPAVTTVTLTVSLGEFIAKGSAVSCSSPIFFRRHTS